MHDAGGTDFGNDGRRGEHDKQRDGNRTDIEQKPPTPREGDWHIIDIVGGSLQRQDMREILNGTQPQTQHITPENALADEHCCLGNEYGSHKTVVSPKGFEDTDELDTIKDKNNQSGYNTKA